MRERTGKSARLKGVSDDFEALNQIIDTESIYKDLPQSEVAAQEEVKEEAQPESTPEAANEAKAEEAQAPAKEEEK